MCPLFPISVSLFSGKLRKEALDKHLCGRQALLRFLIQFRTLLYFALFSVLRPPFVGHGRDISTFF